MSSLLKPRDLRFFLLKKNRSFTSSSSSSSSSFLKHQSLPYCSSSSAPTAPSSNNTNHNNVSWARRLIKFGVVSSLTGAAGGAAYATYAYTLEDVENTTNRLQGLAKYNAEDDAPTLQKFQDLLYSAAMTVPAKSTELYLNLRRWSGDKIWEYTKLLPDMHPLDQRARAFTLVLDLDETLVYTDWQPGRGWRTFKRPGVDAFLEHLAQFYEIVLYTDQPNSYADPIVARLNGKQSIRYALSRSATRYQNGKYYRDLSKMNRDPNRIIYVSGHALESTLQPENSIPVKAWKLEADDTSLLELIPFLEYVGLHKPEDIRATLESYKGRDIASEFKRRSSEQKQFGRLWR